MPRRALADLAGTAIALRDARLAAAIDPLTGCLNHGAMRERLAEEIARARRQGTPLAVTILDLDDFKRVNDTYGHPTGDALLRHVAEALRAEYRSFDQVARYGGDEFVVILPNVQGPAGRHRRGARAARPARDPHHAARRRRTRASRCPAASPSGSSPRARPSCWSAPTRRCAGPRRRARTASSARRRLRHRRALLA